MYVRVELWSIVQGDLHNFTVKYNGVYNICDFVNPITTNIKPQEASITGSNPLYSQMKPFLDVSSNFPQFDPPSEFKGVECRASIKSYIAQKCRELVLNVITIRE